MKVSLVIITSSSHQFKKKMLAGGKELSFVSFLWHMRYSTNIMPLSAW